MADNSTRADLERAIRALRGSPSFSDFIKTLSRRHDAVVASWENGSAEAEALRGEARAYSYIIKAATNTES
jgi:hypothetical protein